MDRAVGLARGKRRAEHWMAHEEALALARSGRLQAARRLSNRAVDLALQEEEREAAASYQAARAVWEAVCGNAAEGKKYFEKVNDLIGTAKLPESVKENLIVGSMMSNVYFLTANGELDKALAESDKCRQKVESRKNPGEEMGLNSLMAFLEIKRGNYDKAIEYYSKSDTENPKNWYYTAVAYSKKGDKQNALKLFEKITKWNVNSVNLALFRKRAMDELKK